MDAEVIDRLTATFKRAPPSENDIDLVAEKGDAEAVPATLERIGMRVEDPPEQWLFKVADRLDISADR